MQPKLTDDDVADLRELVGELVSDDAEERNAAALAIAEIMAGNGERPEPVYPKHDRRTFGDFWQYRWRRGAK